MPPQTRKRFNAFEDFSADPTEAKFKISQEQAALPDVERIERLHPSQMLPDRFQPRRLLPNAIRAGFFTGHIDCYQAATQWLAMSRSDDGIKKEIERLMLMGSSFTEHGQIKPITGSWSKQPDGTYLFLIETGERRFWAACLQCVAQKKKDEPSLRVEVVANPTRQRQVLENRHAEPPSAVEQACEIAALILADIGITPDTRQEDDYDYFRQAQAQRMPVGLWDKLIPLMQFTRPRMVQLLNILKLPTSLLDLADRYRLPERVLREILVTPQEEWERMVRTSIQAQLTSEEVAEIASIPQRAEDEHEARRKPIVPEPGRDAVRSLRKVSRLMESFPPASQAQALDSMANTLMVEGRAESTLHWLDALAQLLRARLKRR